MVEQLDAHRAHDRLVKVQTRPFTPPYEGSDLAHLRIFKSVTTADQFFLYFPWFFDCFGNMDAVRNYLRNTFIARMTEAMEDPDVDKEA